MHDQPNVLVLGASGGLAGALLQLLPTYRDEIGHLILLDQHAHVVESPFLDHQELAYQFVRHTLDEQHLNNDFRDFCRAHDIAIILDITDCSTTPLLNVAQELGTTYINTMLNAEHLSVPEVSHLIEQVYYDADDQPHLLCSGMNPGIVNVWAAEAIAMYGEPERITFFEYDSSRPRHATGPFITWSRKEFLEEAVVEPSGKVNMDGEFELLRPNAISHLVDMRPVLEPVKR